MRRTVKRLIRDFVWKGLNIKRPMILGPNSHVVSRFGDYTLVSTRAIEDRKEYLPIHYSYHTFKNWELRYHIRGSDSGVLRFTLKVPNAEPFCDVSLNVQLPFSWTVELNDHGLLGNGKQLPLASGSQIPRKTQWLVGEFEFRNPAGAIMWRRTGHRVRLRANEADDGYYKWIYGGAYDEESKHYPKEILEVISKYHPLAGKLLDIGCATGLVVAHAQAQGLEATGIDTSSWAVEKANARTSGRCRVLDFDSAKLSDFDTRYDIIILHSVLEHLVDPENSLKLLFDLCSPGGVVYIQTLNADSLMHLIMDKDWGGYTDHTHKSPWITADWIAQTAGRLGFDVANLKRYYVWSDNIYDDVWLAFSSMLQTYPASVILEDRFGDAIEVVLRRPSNEG